MEIITFASTSNVLRIKILDSASATGAGKTGLTSASAGLIISTIADNEAAPTSYTAAGNTIESVVTLGTYAAPTATKVRFREVDATNHPGVYEIQIADARYAVANAKRLLVSVSGAAGMVQVDKVVELKRLDLQLALPANFPSLSISGGGKVAATVATGDLTDLSAARAAKIDFLDAAVTTRMATFVLPANFANLGITAGGKVSGVVLCDTLTNYTNNVPQTGDAFARLGAPAGGVSIAADLAAIMSLLSVVDDSTDTEIPSIITLVTAIKAVIDKLNTAMAQDGLVYQFTANALELAPAGGGGGGAGDIELQVRGDTVQTGGL